MNNYNYYINNISDYNYYNTSNSSEIIVLYDDNEGTIKNIQNTANILSDITKKKNSLEFTTPEKNYENEIKNREYINKFLEDLQIKNRENIFITSNFFISFGFVEKIRKLFLLCLFNYGAPKMGEFPTFYQHFIENAKHFNNNKTKFLPSKIQTQFYYEFFNYFLIESQSIEGITPPSFFTQKIPICIIKIRLMNINKIKYKYNKNDLDKKIYKILPNFIDKIIEKKEIKNFNYLSKIITNLLYKGKENGFLNYKQNIEKENIIFQNLELKFNTNKNLRYEISKIIFYKNINETEFNNIITKIYFETINNSNL